MRDISLLARHYSQYRFGELFLFGFTHCVDWFGDFNKERLLIAIWALSHIANVSRRADIWAEWDYFFLYPLGQAGLVAVTFLVVLPFTQVMVVFFAIGAGFVVACVVA